MLPSEPLASPAAASFDAPLDMLTTCHQKVLRFCAQLENLPGYLDAHGITPTVVTTLEGVLRYFDVAGPLHHADEERDLFPLLAQRAPDSQPLLTEIAIEHITLEGMWSRLREQLQAVNAGQAQALDVHLSQAFVQRYRAHIDHEENQLLPLAHQLLSADELEQIGDTMSARRRD